MVACCQNKENHISPNGGLRISTKRSPPVVATTEDNMILSKDKKEMGPLDFKSCDKGNGSTNMIGFEAGIGIAKFLRGKSFFITGATGFLAKGDHHCFICSHVIFIPF